jgi:hypothetical protein
MSRGMTPEFAAALADRNARPVVFYEAEFNSGVLRLWSGLGDIEWNGETWTGAGNLLGFGAIEEGDKVEAYGTSIKLSGIPLDLVQLCIEEARQGLPGKVWVGLMAEPQEARSNLLTWSQEFDNAAWTKGNLSVTPNVAFDADGQLTADKLVENTSNASHQLVRNFPFVAGQRYTVAIDAQAGERDRLNMQIPSLAFPAARNAVFDLSAGAVVSTPFADADVDIIDLGRGRYRCFWSAVASTTATGNFIFARLVQNPNVFSYTGDGSSGLFVSRAQINEGEIADYQRVMAGTEFDPARVGRRTLIADPVLAASGRLDVPNLEDSEDTCSITITYEGRLIGLLQAREWRYTDESQQVLFPGDRGFEYVTTIQDKDIQWGTK